MIINHSSSMSAMDVPSANVHYTEEPALFLNNLPFQTPAFLVIGDLRDRKIRCAKETLTQLNELEKMEPVIKRKLICLNIGVVLTGIVAGLAIFGGLLAGAYFLAALIGGGIAVGILLGIAAIGIGVPILIKIISLFVKLFVSIDDKIEQPKTDLNNALTQNIKDWHEQSAIPDLHTTLTQMAQMFPHLERLNDPILCNALERDYNEQLISQRYKYQYEDFLSKEMEGSDFLSYIEKHLGYSKEPYQISKNSRNFLSRLPENIRRYDQLELRRAELKAALITKNSDLEQILGIAEGYAGFFESPKKSADPLEVS